jgi:hypothetical protein
MPKNMSSVKVTGARLETKKAPRKQKINGGKRIDDDGKRQWRSYFSSIIDSSET